MNIDIVFGIKYSVEEIYEIFFGENWSYHDGIQNDINDILYNEFNIHDLIFYGEYQPYPHPLIPINLYFGTKIISDELIKKIKNSCDVIGIEYREPEIYNIPFYYF